MTLQELYDKEVKLRVGHHHYYLRNKGNFKPNAFATKYYIGRWHKNWLKRKVISWSYEKHLDGYNDGAYGFYTIQLGYKAKEL